MIKHLLILLLFVLVTGIYSKVLADGTYTVQITITDLWYNDNRESFRAELKADIYHNGQLIQPSGNYYYKWYVYYSYEGYWHLSSTGYGKDVDRPETVLGYYILSYVVVTDSVSHTFKNIQSSITDPLIMTVRGRSVKFDVYLENGEFIKSIIPEHWRYTINRWKDGYHSFLTENHDAIIRAKPNYIDSLQEKFHHWNYDASNIIHYKSFFIDTTQGQSITAQYISVKWNVVIKTVLMDGLESDYDSIQFKDPWVVDTTDYRFYTTPCGYHSLGMLTPFLSESSIFQPTFTSKYQGVFLNQGWPNWEPPYYSVQASPQQIIPFHGQSITWYFQCWRGDPDSVAFEHPNQDSTAVVFKQDGAVARAVYKGHLVSSLSNATAFNNAHRLVKACGKYHFLYLDNEDIYYTSSTNLSNWDQESLISDQSNGNAFNPALTVNADGKYLVWAEKAGDRTHIYGRYFYPDGTPFFYTSFYNTSSPIDPHPIIETDSPDQGAKIIYVFEGSDGLYWGYTQGDYFWSSPSKIPNTNSNSKFPSLQMRAFPWRMVYEENQKIYTMTFNWATKQWSARSQISSSGRHPNICGEYTGYSYYWVAYDCSSMPPTWTVKVYRSKTGTYYSFTNFMRWYYYPAIRSDEIYSNLNITLTFEESYYHDVYYSLFNSSTGTWGSLNLLSNDGEKPNIAVNYNPVSSDIIWTSDSYAPHRIKTYPEQRGEMLIENQLFSYDYSREIQFDLSQYPLIKNNGLNISGEISVKIRPYMINQDTIPFIILTDSASANNFFTSSPFLVNQDSMMVRMTIQAKNLQIPSILVNGDDINLFRLDLKLDENDKYLSTLYNLTMNGLTSLGQDSFVVNKTIHTNLSAYTNRIVRIEENYIKRSPNFKPIFIENYEIVSNDSLQLQNKSLSQKETASKNKENVVLNEFRLYANYPNPFNPTTTISFDLPQNVNVRMDIFDIEGRKICTLVNEPKKAGTHQVIWNGQDDHGNSVASGVYVYRIQAGDFVQSKKLLFMK